MLDRYHIEHELKTGARGAVFRGCDKETGQVVAIKLFADSDPGSRPAKRFLATRDARPSRTHLSHPHIPQIYETGCDGYLRYEVMQFIEGVDLRAYVDPSTLLPLRTVLALTARIAGAIEYLHASGFVHGDIKPSNIVFDAVTGGVSLTDVPSDVENLDNVGTAAYMAPERLRGSPPSAASDQFSLGITLYQLACGHLPFSGRSRPAILSSMASAVHVDVRSYDADLPGAFAAIIGKLLCREVSSRYSGLKALRQALEAVGVELDSRRGRGWIGARPTELSCAA